LLNQHAQAGAYDRYARYARYARALDRESRTGAPGPARRTFLLNPNQAPSSYHDTFPQRWSPVSLIAGILILLMPRLLNFIVAIYLIIIGLVGLFGLGSLHV
jgi:hypothetical protein